MIYNVVVKNLLTVDTNIYTIAHCVSCDKAMGAGVAKQLKYKFPQIVNGTQYPAIGTAEYVPPVINIFTKARYFHKPTYDSLYFGLAYVYCLCITHQLKHLAMPKIGCGLDKLDWNTVEEHIKQKFENLDIEILVCVLGDIENDKL